MGKKRQSKVAAQREPLKQTKQKHPNVENDAAKEEGLFDNLEEQMDPSLLDSVLQQIESGDDEGQSLASQDEAVEDSDIESNEANDIEMNTEEEDSGTQILQQEAEVQDKGEKIFRDHYMNDITVAFGSDLDKIRQEPNFDAVRLKILIDSLEAGVNIFSDLEQEIILAEREKA